MMGADINQAMGKRVLQASIRVSEFPRVRFFQRGKAKNGADCFVDVTHNVAKLVLEEAEGDAYDLLRLNSEGKLVWRTHHLSMQEVKWHVEFEYGLPEEKWSRFEEESD